MAYGVFSFDEEGARRVVRTVRQSEGSTFTRDGFTIPKMTGGRAPTVAAVRVVGSQAASGLWPANFETLATTTTGAPTTTSTTTTSDPTSTTTTGIPGTTST